MQVRFPLKSRFWFTFVSTLLLVFLFQNCGLESSMRFSGKPTSLKSVSGNGEGYEGKIKGRYVRVVPDHPCDKQGEVFGEIKIKEDMSVELVQANSKDSCEKSTKELRLVDLNFAEYNPLVVGYREGTYVKADEAVKPNLKDQWFLESWCRMTDHIYNGVHTLIYYNPVQKLARSRIVIGMGLVSGIPQVRTVPNFTVSRNVAGKQASYVGKEFNLHVDLSKYRDGTNGEFEGQLHASVDDNELNVPVRCRTAGVLDGETFTLSFTGFSDPRSAIADRIFNETDSPAWTLTGQCDPNLGDVEIISKDISAQTKTPCLADGSFVQDIAYDDASSNGSVPFFAGNSAMGRQAILIQQLPATPKSTDLFLTGSNSTVQIITTAADLQSLPTQDGGVFILANDIDVAGELGSSYNWNPIGKDAIGVGTPFGGIFEGNGFAISNININRPGDNRGQGLFGYISLADIRNLKLKNVNVTSPGSNNVGALVGYSNFSSIKDVHVENTAISGIDRVGGFIGDTWNSDIKNCSSQGVVRGRSRVGGFVGNSRTSLIERSFAVVNVEGTEQYVGGLLGDLWYGRGSIQIGAIRDSYAVGTVRGKFGVGGIVGHIALGGEVTRSYSQVQVEATDSHLAGPIYGHYDDQGYINPPEPKLTDLYWVNDLAACSGCDTFIGTGLSFEEMMKPFKFSNWNINQNSNWIMIEELTTPHLKEP